MSRSASEILNSYWATLWGCYMTILLHAVMLGPTTKEWRDWQVPGWLAGMSVVTANKFFNQGSNTTINSIIGGFLLPGVVQTQKSISDTPYVLAPKSYSCVKKVGLSVTEESRSIPESNHSKVFPKLYQRSLDSCITLYITLKAVYNVCMYHSLHVLLRIHSTSPRLNHR